MTTDTRTIPEVCVGCLGWLNGRCEWHGDWRECEDQEKADAAIASGEVVR